MLQLICNKGNCIIPRICATFLMNLSSSSFSLDENYWSFISSKQTEISKMKAFLLLVEKGFKTWALPLLVEKEYIWNTRKRSNHCGGFFINADSKNGCNTFSDSIFVNWLQRYSIFGQITRMKQFPFWRKKPPQHLMPLLYLLIYEKYYSGKLISTHCANGCVVASFGEKFNKHFDLGLGFEWVFKHWQRVDIIN